MTGSQNFRTSVLTLDRPGDPTVFGEDVRAAAAELVSRYPAGQSRSALLPMLHLVQSEQGYVSPDGIAFCADFLDLTKAQVAAVVTFYTMYKRKPTGEYLVSVCTNTLCAMLGGDEIYAALSETLGVGMNETTADGKITLEHAECLAACDYAPVVTVNYEFFDNQTVDSAGELVTQLQAGERPLPTRGAPLCTFKQIECQIAGFFDERPEVLEAEATGIPTEVGVRLAVERRESAPSFAISRDDSADTGRGDTDRADTGRADAARAETGPAETGRAQSEKAAGRSSRQPTSSHDAPLKTSATSKPTPGDEATPQQLSLGDEEE